MCSSETLRQSLVLRMHIMSVISAATLWQSLNLVCTYLCMCIIRYVCFPAPLRLYHSFVSYVCI